MKKLCDPRLQIVTTDKRERKKLREYSFHLYYFYVSELTHTTYSCNAYIKENVFDIYIVY